MCDSVRIRFDSRIRGQLRTWHLGDHILQPIKSRVRGINAVLYYDRVT